MERKNVFISNYLRIEREIIDLSHSVDFCDEQLQVYSTIICDLIIRCGTDIESLYKEIYRRLICKTLPNTVGNVAKELDKRLNLTDKVLNIENTKFNFYNFNTIKPFKYKQRTEDDFYHVFCCLKHDRQKSFQKATLRVLILSVGALYVLNQYYLDEQQFIENSFFGEVIPAVLSRDTSMFSACVFNEAWSTIDSRFQNLKDKSELAEEKIAQLKMALLQKTNIQLTNSTMQECLFRVEPTPDYNKFIQTFTKQNTNNTIARETLIYSIFGNDEDINSLLQKHGTNVLDGILSMLATTLQRHRLRIVINS